MMIKDNIKSVLFDAKRILIGIPLICLLSACGEVEVGDGVVTNTIPLPLSTDTSLDLYCVDVGIGNNRCILDDPANPFAKIGLNDVTKFELYKTTPSPKASFYLWATAQAKISRGENQYYTALSLHKMFTDGGSTDLIIGIQALKAYRAVLDNHFDEVTFFGPFIDVTTGDEIYFPEYVRNLTIKNLYLPIPTPAANQFCGQDAVGTNPDGLAPLFTDNLAMLSALGEAGYTLDLENCTIGKNF